MTRRYNLGHDALDQRVAELVRDVGAPAESAEFLEEAVTAILKMGQDGADRWDAKMARTALKEMRHAFRMFAQYRDVPKVTVFGSARLQPGTPVFEMARRFGEKMADRGYMVVTGAGPGIMAAANLGAGTERSFGLGIQLPFEQRANDVMHGDPKFINFRFFFVRKLFFLKDAHAVVLCPGGFGTMDETFEALTLMQTGRSPIIPVVMMDRPGGGYWSTWRYGLVDKLIRDGMISAEDVHLFRVVEHEDDAVEAIERFYRVYHSQRVIGDELVLRLKRPLDEATVHRLSREFAGCLRPGTGPLRMAEAFPEEANEPELAHLPRLVVPFDERNHGLLRRLIDAINGTPPGQAPGAGGQPPLRKPQV